MVALEELPVSRTKLRPEVLAVPENFMAVQVALPRSAEPMLLRELGRRQIRLRQELVEQVAY
jgi:hypothetical protein